MGNEVIVQLTWEELTSAAVYGILRRVKALNNALKNKNGYDKLKTWQIDIEGALGEVALAKYLGVFWGGLWKIDGVDVGKNNEARTTAWKNGKLRIDPDSHDDRKYWLLRGKDGRYEVAGWMMGKDGKRDEWWADIEGDGRFAFWVPAEKLTKP